MKLTNEQIQQHIAALPDNIRHAVMEFDWVGEIMSIGRAHQVQIDDIEVFRHETVKVMLGIESAGSYQDNIMKEMGISKDLAMTLVEKANDRIFHELQKRAFHSEEGELFEKKPDYVENQDPYLEPIEHHELRHAMKEEGIHLLDHDDLIQPETNLEQKEQIFTKEEPETTTIKGIIPQATKSSSYQEPIDESDLKGVRTQNIDMSILKQQHQSKPEQVFSSDEVVSTTQSLPDTNQDLEKHNFSNEYVAKKISVDASPEQSELIKEEGSFLAELSKTEEE